MANRCVFFMREGRIIREVFNLDWNLGFTADAKIKYISNAYEILKEKIPGETLDVTSANKTSQEGYLLSPFYLRVQHGMNFEDYYMKTKSNDDDWYTRMLFYDWLYGVTVLSNGKRCVELVEKYDNFIDIFHKPDNHHCTQAKSCAVLKLAMQTRDPVKLYSSSSEFYAWRIENVNFIT